jgi:phosphoribosyl 1,2-cyclic phosphodiesterase
VRISVLASGSKGNAVLFESGSARILVDVGIGPRTLAARIEQAGGGGMPDAIVVTHSHTDHGGCCAMVARKLGVPVYATKSVARAIDLGDRDRVHLFGTREPFAIGPFSISPMPVPHDAAQVSLVVADGRSRAGIATDLGEIPPALVDHLAQCDVLLIESNHDLDMLACGSYPAHLEKRIRSAHGHLSNDQTHALLACLPARTHTVVLMHISENNNDPRIALRSAADALAGRRVRIIAAKQRDVVVVDTLAPARGG